MKRIFFVAALGMLLMASISPTAAKDQLVVGYTAITGIKAWLWVAIEPHLVLIPSASKMVQGMLGGDVPRGRE